MHNPIPSAKGNSAEHKEKSDSNTEQHQNSAIEYNSLSPIDNADEKGHYSEMLYWALRNRKKKDIKNIAITGPYGSGKSSILKTFEKKNTDKDIVFLNISLAKFKDEIEIEEQQKKITRDKQKEPINPEPADQKTNSSGEKNIVEKETLLRLIEYSIVQQIFYHEKDEDIPDSRFKKTRSFSEHSAWTLTWSIFLFITALLYEIYSKEFWGIFNTRPVKCLDISIHLLMLGTLLFLGFSFIKKSIRPLRHIQLKKFSLQDAEFGIDESISKSILNEHLDEILYFFEVTDYTVVVIEDLDRFQQTGIFTKLRELNHLLNYSKKIEREIVFIYAVRDEMFQDNDRTKFFDFIIPVIPVINSSNSNEILLGIVEKNNYNIKPDLIDDISSFVDDMRLLYNITNEYQLYSKQLSPKLNQNKLLAIILYKNLYPNDFVCLSNSKGELYHVIAEKDEYIYEENLNLEEQISLKKKEIRDLNLTAINNVKDLRKLYVLEYLNTHPLLESFKINNQKYNIYEVLEDESFESLTNDKAAYFYTNANGNQYPKEFTSKFESIEKAVDPNATYIERLTIVDGIANGQIDDLKQEIAALEKRKTELPKKTLEILLREDIINISLKNKKQEQLISILLRYGYIGEDYLDYISIFYEGTLTQKDNEFLLNVKAHINTDFDYQLNKIENLIKKIPKDGFDGEYIFNYSLLDYLLSKPRHLRTPKILKTLSNETDNTISFIDGYLKRKKHNGKFIKLLAKHWTGIWNYLRTKSSFTDEHIELYFDLLIEHAEVADIKKIAEQSDLSSFIENNPYFLSSFKKDEKLKQIIEELNIFFKNLNTKDVSEDLLEFVYRGRFYEINPEMIKVWLVSRGNYDEKEFVEKNYSLLNDQLDTLEKLVEYIDENMSTYLNNVWFKLDSIKQEDPGYFYYIINSTSNIDLVVKALQQNETKLEDIEQFDEISVKQAILDANKLQPTWRNMIYYFFRVAETFDTHLVNFINNNGKELANDKFEFRDKEFVDQLANRFMIALLLNKNIDDKIYDALTDVIPSRFNDSLEFGDLSEYKVRILLKLLNVTPHNFDIIRSKFPSLIIPFIEKDPDAISNDLDSYPLSAVDIALLLTSEKVSIRNKNAFLHTMSDALIISNSQLYKDISLIAIESDGLVISKDVIVAILKSNVDVEHRISLLSKFLYEFGEAEFYDIMRYFPKPFDEIKRNGKQTLIPDTPNMWTFAELCYGHGFIRLFKEDKKGIRIFNLKS